MKLHNCVFYENLSRKFKFKYNWTRIMRTLHENQNTFLNISRSFLLRTKPFSDKSCRENERDILYSIKFLGSRAVYKLMSKNIWEGGRQQMKIWGMRISCWMPMTTSTCSVCVTLTAFPLQQWLYERISVLLYTCIACLMFSHRYNKYKTSGIRHVSISKYIPAFRRNSPNPSSILSISVFLDCYT